MNDLDNDSYLASPSPAPSPAKQLHDAIEAKRAAETRLFDLFQERWPDNWPFAEFHAERDSVYDCSIELDGGKVDCLSRADVEFVLGLGFQKLYYNRNDWDGVELAHLTRCFSVESDYDDTIAWYAKRDAELRAKFEAAPLTRRQRFGNWLRGLSGPEVKR